MKTVKLCVWFFLGLFLGGVATFASAETTSAVLTDGWYTASSTGYLSTWATTKQAACNIRVVELNRGGVCSFTSATSYKISDLPWPNWTKFYEDGYVMQAQKQVCPDASWTLSGKICTRPNCVAPEVRDPADGICKAPPCPAAGQSGAALGATGTFTGTGTMPEYLCVGSCQYDRGGVGVQAGQNWATGIGRATGQSCSGDTGASLPAADPQTDPKTKCVQSGQSFGTVNGVVVCVPATTATKTGSSSSSTTNKDPQGNTTSTSNTSSTTNTTITNNGGSVTKTTITTNPDGSTTTTTTMTEGEGTGEDDEAEDDWGTPPEEGALSERSIGPSSITPVSIGGSGACPAPISLPHNWGSVSYQPACDLAGMIKPITLAFAWLAAVLIAVGGFKDA